MRVWIGRWNKAGSGGAPTTTSSPPGWKPPSVHAVTRLLSSDRDSAPDRDQRLCARLLEEVPELAVAADAARRLARVLRKESTEPLADMLDAMKGTLLELAGDQPGARCGSRAGRTRHAVDHEPG